MLTNEAPQAVVQPQEVQTNAPTASNSVAGAPLKQTLVVYISGVSRITPSNRYTAVLEWGADSRIRLYVKNFQGQEYAVLFDCAPQEIKSFSIGMGVGNIKLRNGQLYSLEFSYEVAYATLASSGGFGLGANPISLIFSAIIDKKAAEVEASTDLGWWRLNLARYGVGGLQMTAKTMYGLTKGSLWVLGIFFGLILLFMLFAGIVYLISALGIA